MTIYGPPVGADGRSGAQHDDDGTGEIGDAEVDDEEIGHLVLEAVVEEDGEDDERVAHERRQGDKNHQGGQQAVDAGTAGLQRPRLILAVVVVRVRAGVHGREEMTAWE